MWRLHPSSRLATMDMGRKLEGCVPFRGELQPHLTQRRLGRGLPPYQVASWYIQPFGHHRHGPKIGWGCALFSARRWVPIEHKVAGAEVYLHTKWHLSPSSRFPTTDIGRKLGRGLCPFRGGELGHRLTQCRLVWGLPPYHVVSWYLYPFGHNRHGPKIGSWAF